MARTAKTAERIKNKPQSRSGPRLSVVIWKGTVCLYSVRDADRTKTRRAGFMLFDGRPVESLDRADAFIAFKEQRKRAGTDVRSGDRLVIDEQDVLRRLRAFPDQLDQKLRILAAGGMRDADRLLLRIDDMRFILRGKRFDGALAAVDHAEI